jgi:hypothetical protein
MRYRTTIIGSAFVFIAVAALWVARASAAASPASAGDIHILSQQPLAGQTGTDVTILTVDYSPGGSTRRTSIRGRRMLMCSKAPWYRRSMMARLKRSLRDRRGPSSRTIIT